MLNINTFDVFLYLHVPFKINQFYVCNATFKRYNLFLRYKYSSLIKICLQTNLFLICIMMFIFLFKIMALIHTQFASFNGLRFNPFQNKIVLNLSYEEKVIRLYTVLIFYFFVVGVKIGPYYGHFSRIYRSKLSFYLQN